ncbi:hypothetical protein AK812_SmicGene4544 [Symbiodinium microadriaticum]|uniref:Uncharacterized protein n=1 Tax=Symbiodinium microadriaticum TaxID=2951 RepID=A0A1Q9EW62_SYMMI|nr:hypothetical protein AK812_SmicGene4544 [Symbiodinium microadriaticum]
MGSAHLQSDTSEELGAQKLGKASSCFVDVDAPGLRPNFPQKGKTEILEAAAVKDDVEAVPVDVSVDVSVRCSKSGPGLLVWGSNKGIALV